MNTFCSVTGIFPLSPLGERVRVRGCTTQGSPRLPAGPHPRPSPASGRGKRKAGGRKTQRGVSLFVVLVILLLALILVLGGLTVGSLNESIVGNQSDAQRAYSSAQALLAAAQRDIRLNGRHCNAALIGGQGANANFQNAACIQRFPRDMDEYMELVNSGKIAKSGCADPGTAADLLGVCIALGPTDGKFAGDAIANPAGASAQQWDNGAGYGNKFIAALDAGGAGEYGGNAQLGSVNVSQAIRGRYWVEVFPYNVTSVAVAGMGRAPVPDNAYPFIFRITAMSTGIKGGTVSVLRSYYTPFPMPPAP